MKLLLLDDQVTIDLTSGRDQWLAERPFAEADQEKIKSGDEYSPHTAAILKHRTNLSFV